MDLPAPARQQPRTQELDLPAPASFDMPSADLELEGPGGSMELDLPAPAPGGAGNDKTLLGTAPFDLPTPAAGGGADPLSLDLPAPAGDDFGGGRAPSGLDDLDLPAPTEDLPTPAADLEPADFGGLQLDIDRVGHQPEPEPRPGFEGGYASTGGGDYGALELDSPGAAPDEAPAANLVDAVESPEPAEPAEPAEPESADAAPQPEEGTGAGRQLSTDDIINHRASPAPKQIPVFTKKRLIIGGVVLVLIAGGLGGAFAMGVFDPPPEATVQRGAGTRDADAPAGPAKERAGAILARFDEGTPQAIQQAQAMAETQGDRVGQAEAALLLDYRYGPDPVLVGKARGLLAGYENDEASHVQRVYGLLHLADDNAQLALTKLGGDDPRAALYRAWAALELGDAKGALEHAEAASKAQPDSAGAALAKARARAALEADGIAVLGEAYEAHKEHPRFIYDYAEALLEDGQLAKAAEVASAFEVAPSSLPSFQASTLRLRARIARAQGKSAEALRLLDEARDRNAQDLQVAIDRIYMLLDQGDLATSRSEADILSRDNPELFDASLLAAEVAIALGEGDLAIERLDALGEAAAKMARVQRMRARVFAIRMQLEQASQYFDKARELDPLDAESTAIEAAMFQRADQAAKAFEAVDEHLAALDTVENPNPRNLANATSHLLRARAGLSVSAGDPRTAKADLKKALEANPNDNQARLELARAHLALGERTQAEKTFLALADRTESFPGLTGPLGRIYLRRGELEKLEKLIADRLADERASDEVMLTGALLRLEQDRPDDAMKLVERVLARNPASWEGHLARGQILFRRGEAGAALIELEQARPSDPNADVEFWLGRALEATGEERKATARFQRAVEIEPGHVLAAAHLGRRLAFGGQSRAAIEMLEPLVSETEEFPFAFAVLGRAHYDAGNRAKALVFLRKARRLDPSSFEAAYWEGRIEGDANNHQAAARALAAAVEVAEDEGTQTQDAWRRLGRAYAALGRNDAARSAFRKYLEIAPPDAAGRAEAQRKLRDL